MNNCGSVYHLAEQGLLKFSKPAVFNQADHFFFTPSVILIRCLLLEAFQTLFVFREVHVEKLAICSNITVKICWEPYYKAIWSTLLTPFKPFTLIFQYLCKTKICYIFFYSYNSGFPNVTIRDTIWQSPKIAIILFI